MPTGGNMKIALMGPFGFGNLGDAASQQAMIEAIRWRIPGVQIVGISQNPEDTEARHGIQSYPISRLAREGGLTENDAFVLVRHRSIGARLRTVIARALLEFRVVARSIKNLKGCDWLIVSGGGQLDESYGGPFGHPYALLKWAVIARWVRARFAVVSVGAGPLNSRLGIFFVKRMLRLSEYTSFRDGDSRDLMASLGHAKRDPVFPDLAHSLTLSRDGTKGETITVGRIVGLGVIDYADPRSWPVPDGERYQAYLTKLAEVVQWILARGYSVKLLRSMTGADLSVAQDLVDRVKARISGFDEKRITVQSGETVDELMETMAGTGIVIASRFHGVLLAHVLERPVIALSYHRKVTTLMKDMGHADYCLDIKNFTVADLIEKFKALEQHRGALVDQIRAKEHEYRQALEQQYDLLFGQRG